MARSRSSQQMDFEERMQDATDWMRLHTRELTTGAVIVAAVAIGTVIYTQSKRKRDENATRTFAEAVQALSAGNSALAQRDLERISTRYAGTAAGSQGTLLLAQLYYDRGEYQKGISALQRLRDLEDSFLAAAVENLVGAGYDQMGRYAEAAQHYRAAAGKSSFDDERANYLASAARAYGNAGNTVEAKKIWKQLASDPDGAGAAEARLRLGEIEAKPAARV